MSARARVTRSFPVILVAAGLVSCGSPEKEAVNELNRRGIAVNGLSLLAAVDAGETEVVRLLLAAEVFTGQRDSRGRTPLHVAIDAERDALAWQLIEAGADLNAATQEKVTPLALALVRGRTPLVERLLERGAGTGGRMPGGDGLLTWAIRRGDMSFVKSMMERGADPHQVDDEGTPLIHVAMEAGREALAMELLERGADAAVLNRAGESTLVVALRQGWRPQLAELVRRGADPNLPDRDGRTSFDLALQSLDVSLARELLKLGSLPRGGGLDGALRQAYARRDRGECGMLLALGARPSPSSAGCLVRRSAADDETGFLHLFLGHAGVPDGLLGEFCRGGRTHIAALLIAHGAEVNPPRAPFLDTPFLTSLARGGPALSLRLLDAGASPDAGTWHGQSPLQLAILRGRGATLRRMLETGAAVEEPLATPADPEFLKHVRGRTLRWLLAKDSRVTPLMLAVDSGSLAAARVLLENGAKTNVWTRKFSIWPINIAAGHQDVPMMRLLLGQDPDKEERRVVISLSEQRLRVFGRDDTELLETRVSTGRKGFATPTGTFVITNRYRDWTSTIYDASMPFFQRLSCSDFGFHQGNVPGYPASHGCIRVPAGYASKLFALTRLGDRVDIVP